MTRLGHVLITGANRGIGLGLAELYLAEGWMVRACCRNPKMAASLAQLAESLPGRLVLDELDVTSEASIGALEERVGSQPLDLLINNAATYGPRGTTLWTVDPVDWALVHTTNVIGPTLLARALLPALLRAERAVIANISSRQGSVAELAGGGKYAYRTSKAALNMMTRSLAVDLRDRGVICLGVEPGWVRTRMGEPGAQIGVAESARGIKRLLSSVTPEQSGRFLDYCGAEVPW